MARQPNVQGSLLAQSWLQAGRILIRWRRDPVVLGGSLIFPICLLVVYKLVLDQQVHKVTGVESVYGLVPMCAMLAAILGALSNAVGITVDRDSGLLSRMWVLPVHRASALAGRLTAEATRAFLGTVLITAVGVLMGLRFTRGWFMAIAYVLIPPTIVVGVTALIAALAIRARGQAVVTWLAAGITALILVNSSTTPITMYPSWLQSLVRAQPMSAPIELMSSLTRSGPVLQPLALTITWAVVLLATFVPVAVRGYRSAAEST